MDTPEGRVEGDHCSIRRGSYKNQFLDKKVQDDNLREYIEGVQLIYMRNIQAKHNLVEK